MTVKDILPSHPVEIMVRTNYPESLLPYLTTRAVFLLLTRIASNAREFWFTTNAYAHRLRELEKRPMRKAVTVKRWG